MLEFNPLEEKEAESILSKFIIFQRISFVIGINKSNFTVMKRKSKIIKLVLTLGSAFVIFMAFMVASKFM